MPDLLFQQENSCDVYFWPTDWIHLDKVSQPLKLSRSQLEQTTPLPWPTEYARDNSQPFPVRSPDLRHKPNLQSDGCFNL